MKKNLKKHDWSSTEVGTLIEDFTSQVKLVAEQTAEIPKINKKVDLIQEDLEVMKTDLDVMKADMNVMREDMNVTKEDIGTMKVDINVMKNLLKKKVDVEEFAALEHRVALLESRR